MLGDSGRAALCSSITGYLLDNGKNAVRPRHSLLATSDPDVVSVFAVEAIGLIDEKTPGPDKGATENATRFAKT